MKRTRLAQAAAGAAVLEFPIGMIMVGVFQQNWLDSYVWLINGALALELVPIIAETWFANKEAWRLMTGNKTVSKAARGTSSRSMGRLSTPEKIGLSFSLLLSVIGSSIAVVATFLLFGKLFSALLSGTPLQFALLLALVAFMYLILVCWAAALFLRWYGKANGPLQF